MIRTKSEKTCCDLLQTISKKESEISELQKEIVSKTLNMFFLPNPLTCNDYYDTSVHFSAYEI